MNFIGHSFLAASNFDAQVKRATQGHLDTRDVLIGLTLALAVGAGIVLWIYFRSRMKSNDQDRERISQMTRGQSSGKRREKNDEKDEKKSTTTVTKDGLHRRRKHRRRRDHRARNPSLSETGGLPPPRPDDQLPKY
jgi:hypothetical protein